MLPDTAAFMTVWRDRIQSELLLHLAALPPHSVRLRDAMQYACMQGGKRIRPILCYATATAVGADPQRADASACAVELIHCYSLIHDDLPAMDDDDLRRGQPTVHRAFDEATAILAGDALQAMAFRLLTDPARSPELEPAQRLRMVHLLSRAAGYEGMVSGQAIDEAATGQLISLQALEQMHSLKTGALITVSVQLGALCAGASPVMYEALSRYAARIGLAFQVQDDILDVVSDTATLGKRQGADLALNKPTYVSLLGLEGAQAKAAELIAQAISELEEFDERAEPLRALARYIVARRS
jgi:geranylgeranyl diphosphate synthase, type II